MREKVVVSEGGILIEKITNGIGHVYGTVPEDRSGNSGCR